MEYIILLVAWGALMALLTKLGDYVTSIADSYEAADKGKLG